MFMQAVLPPDSSFGTHSPGIQIFSVSPGASGAAAAASLPRRRRTAVGKVFMLKDGYLEISYDHSFTLAKYDSYG
jgi:hypothetical protein